MTSSIHTDPGASPRIASLVPSVTELLFELGLGRHMVARTGYCIHPFDQVRLVPKIGGTKQVNLPKLKRLAPTHLIVNIDENRVDTVNEIRAWGAEAPEIIVTHPQDPLDNLALVQQMVSAFGHLDGVLCRGAAITEALRQVLATTVPGAREPKRVLYLIWHGPWMTVARDTYLSRMLARVNWQTLPDQLGGPTGAARYPVVHGDEPWLAEVQRVLLSSEPFAFGQEHASLASALCPQASVQRVDGELLSWYGARAVPGLRYLRELADASV